jgi:methionine-rich copper-binding protein CopC
MRRTARLRPRTAHRRHLLLCVLVLGFGMTLLALLPVGPASRLIPEALAHALPVRSKPTPNAILRKPPSQVTIWFDDALVPTNSHMSVLDPKGNEVDRRDSRVSHSNPRNQPMMDTSQRGPSSSVSHCRMGRSRRCPRALLPAGVRAQRTTPCQMGRRLCRRLLPG